MIKIQNITATFGACKGVGNLSLDAAACERRYPVFGIRYSVTGYRPLVTAVYRLLLTGYWILVTGYWLPVAGYCLEANPSAGKFYARGDAKKPFFALTFDDGPGRITMDLLKLLDKYGVKASFFMLGSSVKTYPERALAVAKAGHLVCNHTYSHKNYFKLDKFPDKEKILDSEIVKAQTEIEKACGVRPVFLRMPNGYNGGWVSAVAA